MVSREDDMLNFDQLAELDGLISRDVGELLHNFAALVPSDQAIVELGSYRGKSTAYLATGAALDYKAPVYAVDAWSEEVSAWRAAVLSTLPSPAFDDFTAQLDKAGVRDGVRVLRSLTTLAADLYDGPPVGLLYIDGDHHREAVLADFRAWRRHLVADAVVIFDDYGVTKNPGVAEAVGDLEYLGELREVDRRMSDRLAIAYPGKVIGERVPGTSK
jgi:predicted O-methyltransferase YrrM